MTCLREYIDYINSLYMFTLTPKTVNMFTSVIIQDTFILRHVYIYDCKDINS